MRLTTTIALCVLFSLIVGVPAVASAGVIPLPRQTTVLDGIYQPPQDVIIEATDENERHVAAFLAAFLQSRGLHPTVQPGFSDQALIRLSAEAHDQSIGPEGYRLLVGSGGVTIQANAGAGLFYGVQTLEQLANVDASGKLTFPSVRIVDWPEYRWRGIHLDVSRHFFGVPVVKQYIDLAARYKLNTFHWHLTDDQGWRIQIRKYPRLTAAGGCRDGTQVGGEGSTVTDGRRYCGFYTQDEIRDIVAYAAARYMTVVPEIEGPGHSTSAVSAYPWLGCDGKQYPVRQLWGVSTHIMCPTERTFGFIDDVIGEVAGLFPGPYVHIGGDEVPKDAWEASAYVTALRHREHMASYDAVQGYFTRRVEQIASKHGKRIVGWDEILDGGVSHQAIVMAWEGVGRGVQAIKRGNDVVMSPDGLLYLDAAQGNQDYEPLSIGGLLALQMVYEYNPMPPGLSDAQARHVLGAQGNVWAEYIPTADHLFYMLLPRELAVAELAWTPRALMNWDDFSTRLGGELARLDADGYHYRIPDVVFRLDSAGVEFPEQQPVQNELHAFVSGSQARVTLREIAPGATIHYTLDGSTPTAASPTYTAPLSVTLLERQTTTVAAIAVLTSGRASAPSFLKITQH